MSAEITVPETEPETEWVRGRPVQKMSPQRDHGRLQGKLFAALDAWAASHGEVATEWRFRVAPSGEPLRPLVPDIAFVDARTLAGLTRQEIQIPSFAPTVAIEIVSSGDNRKDIDDKIDVYIRAGTKLVLIVDPHSRTIERHDDSGCFVLERHQTLTHDALPGFSLDIAAYFEAALRLFDDRT